MGLWLVLLVTLVQLDYPLVDLAKIKKKVNNKQLKHLENGKNKF